MKSKQNNILPAFNISYGVGIVFFFLISTTLCLGQSSPATKDTKSVAAANSQNIKSSAAYAEILLRKTELESTIESLLESYKEDFPKIKEARYELSMLQKDYEKLLKQTETSKLTTALGKLIVRKNELETDLWALQNRFGKDHPEVVRAVRKAEIFRKAVSEIIP